MHRMLSPFYVLNVCVCALYLVPRFWFAHQEANGGGGAEFWARVRHNAYQLVTSAGAVRAKYGQAQATRCVQERQVYGLLSLSLAFKVSRYISALDSTVCVLHVSSCYADLVVFSTEAPQSPRAFLPAGFP